MTTMCKNGCPISGCLKQFWFAGLCLIGIFAIWITNTNESVFYFLNSKHAYLPDFVWNTLNFVAYSRYYIWSTILLAVAFIMRRDKFLNTLLVVFSYYVIFYLIKHAAHEPRPFIVLDPSTLFWLNHFEDLSKANDYHSFPSGHSGGMAVFVFSMIYLLFQKNTFAKAALIGLLVLTMLSRVCSGWHWPIDVLSGALFGFILVKICYSIPFKKA